MLLTRREFLVTVAAASAAFAVPEIAFAQPQGIIVPDNEIITNPRFNKYKEALRLGELAVSTYTDWKAIPVPQQDWYTTGITVDAKMHEQLDECLLFMNTNFSSPSNPPTRREIDTYRIIMEGGYWDTSQRGLLESLVWIKSNTLEYLRQAPRDIVESLYPIAMVKWWLRDMALPIHHRTLNQFTAFHKRYGPMMLNAYGC